MAGLSEKHSPNNQTLDTSRWQTHDSALIDPYSLLGLAAALALIVTDEDVARFTAGATRSTVRAQLGAVAIQDLTHQRMRVFGQFRDAPLTAALSEEMEGFFASAESSSHVGSAKDISEIELRRDLWPRAVDTDLRRLLLVRLKTIGTNSQR